jgi:hypothetical protein
MGYVQKERGVLFTTNMLSCWVLWHPNGLRGVDGLPSCGGGLAQLLDQPFHALDHSVPVTRDA